MSDLLYRPDLTPDKNYDSEGDFLEDVIETEEEDPSGGGSATKPLDELTGNIELIEAVVGGLPASIGTVITIPITGIKSGLSEIDRETFDPDYVPSDTTIVITPGGSDNTGGGNPSPAEDSDDDTGEIDPDDDDYVPGNIFSESIPDIAVKVNKLTIPERIRQEYDKDLVSIIEDYIRNLKITLTTYYTNLTGIAVESGITNTAQLATLYTGSAAVLKDKNLMHLSDGIVRSQIVRDQKTRLIKKMYSVSETVTKLRACKIAKELRERYYAQTFRENQEMLDVNSNMILSNARMGYDAKYKESLYDLYKYLNSSVILINECLGMLIEEAQAKALLIKNEGMKLT